MAAVAVGLATGTRAHGQDSVLIVRQTRDAGGNPVRLNVRLTGAMERFLRDNAGGAFLVSQAAASKSSSPIVLGRYLLESDLAFAAGRREEDGRYMLVERLYRDDARRTVVGQWTGVSNSLRYLTANLRQIPGVHTLGLIGELGTRIVAAVKEDATTGGQRFRRLAARMRGDARAHPETVTGSEYAALLPAVAAAVPFRLRFPEAPADRSYYLVSEKPSGALQVVLPAVGQPAITVMRGMTRISSALRLPDDVTAAWVLWRTGPDEHRASGSSDHAAGASRDTSGNSRHSRCANVNRDYLSACAELSTTRTRCEDSTAQAELPIHILEGVGSGHPEPDAGADRFLAEVSRDPARWSCYRISILPNR